MNQYAKVHVLHTGELTYDRSLAFKELEVIPAFDERGEAHQHKVPVASYLIEHPQGKIVVDAGWHEQIRTNPKEHLGEDIYQFIKYRLPAGQSIKEQLAAKQISPADLDAVVVTHLDVDHISGLALLTGAKQFLVSKPEWENHLDASKDKWVEGIESTPFELEPIPYGPHQLGKDVFGDGLVYLVFTPGHTAGHISVLVRVATGWLLLVSDVGYAAKSWVEQILPGYTVDEGLAYQALQWVAEFAQRPDCVAAIANHDPQVQPTSF